METTGGNNNESWYLKSDGLSLEIIYKIITMFLIRISLLSLLFAPVNPVNSHLEIFNASLCDAVGFCYSALHIYL